MLGRRTGKGSDRIPRTPPSLWGLCLVQDFFPGSHLLLALLSPQASEGDPALETLMQSKLLKTKRRRGTYSCH